MPSLASRASTSPAIGRVLHAYEICCDKRPEHSLGRATPTSLPGDGFPPFCAFRPQRAASNRQPAAAEDESRSRTRSEEHTSELQSLMRISYAVFCLKKKKLYIQTNIYY